jgi:hypothetical protein
MAAYCNESQAGYILDLAETHVLPEPRGATERGHLANLDAVRAGAYRSVVGRDASRLIGWLQDLDFAEGHEPTEPGIYRDGDQLYLVKRRAKTPGTYAMLVTRKPNGRPGTRWDKDDADASRFTAEDKLPDAEAVAIYAELA